MCVLRDGTFYAYRKEAGTAALILHKHVSVWRRRQDGDSESVDEESRLL